MRPLLLPALAALLLAGCSGAWRPPPRDPLDGWEPMEPREEGVRTWVRESATVDILDPVEMTPAEARRRVETAENARERLVEITGFDDVEDVSVAPVREFEGIEWSDITFRAGGAERRMRIAWFDSAEGLRIFRLTVPARDWTSAVLSPFHDRVRLEKRIASPPVAPGE